MIRFLCINGEIFGKTPNKLSNRFLNNYISILFKRKVTFCYVPGRKWAGAGEVGSGVIPINFGEKNSNACNIH